MKNLLFKLFAVTVITFGLASCTDDDTMTSESMSSERHELKANPGEYFQMAYDNGHSLFATALVQSELNKELDKMGPVTIFAPTNEAFANLLTTVGQGSLDDLPKSVLRQILLNHVVDGQASYNDLSSGAEFLSKAGDILSFEAGEVVTIGQVSLVEPVDMMAGFGYFHSIDDVLVPTDVAAFVNSSLEPAYFNKNFTTLVSAVSQAGLVEALMTTEGLTIFAPTNNAFAQAGIDLTTIDKETLTKVLTYHVVGAKVMSNAIPREAITLNGSHIFFSATRSGSFINGDIEIVAVDITSGQAVVHVIDQVLLPAAGTIVEKAIELTASGEFTMLVDALVRTAEEGTPEQNLISVLNSEGPFSVFAPTNAAFEGLLKTNISWNEISDIPLDVLIEVLTYHVIPARAYDKDLSSALDGSNQVITASGEKIKVDINNLRINGSASIVGVNTHATNGVIHVIDQVLLPSKFSLQYN